MSDVVSELLETNLAVALSDVGELQEALRIKRKVVEK